MWLKASGDEKSTCRIDYFLAENQVVGNKWHLVTATCLLGQQVVSWYNDPAKGRAEPPLRLLITVASLTTVRSLYWLHDGDLEESAELYTPGWNAELLAQNAGLKEVE
jgi:hypothetical protein